MARTESYATEFKRLREEALEVLGKIEGQLREPELDGEVGPEQTELAILVKQCLDGAWYYIENGDSVVHRRVSKIPAPPPLTWIR